MLKVNTSIKCKLLFALILYDTFNILNLFFKENLLYIKLKSYNLMVII